MQDCVTKIYEDLLVAAYIPPPPSEETLEKIDKLYIIWIYKQTIINPLKIFIFRKEIEKDKLKKQKQMRSSKKQNRGKQYRDD